VPICPKCVGELSCTGECREGSRRFVFVRLRGEGVFHVLIAAMRYSQGCLGCRSTQPVSGVECVRTYTPAPSRLCKLCQTKYNIIPLGK